MTAPIYTKSSVRKPNSPFSKSAASTSHRTSTSSLSSRLSPGMQAYKDLLDITVRCLMKEGLTFIEAYEEILAVGRLDPFTTVKHLAQTDPSTDRSTLLEFKAHNAFCRLQKKYLSVLIKYPNLLNVLNTPAGWTKPENFSEQINY